MFATSLTDKPSPVASETQAIIFSHHPHQKSCHQTIPTLAFKTHQSQRRTATTPRLVQLPRFILSLPLVHKNEVENLAVQEVAHVIYSAYFTCHSYTKDIIVRNMPP